MLDQIRLALGKAHATISKSPVALWFPALFNTLAAVLVLLAAVMLLMPVMPELFLAPEALSMTPELLAAASGRMLLLLALVIPVLIIANAGAVFMQARAAQGEPLDTSHFWLGVRVIGLKIFAGNALVWSAYGLVFFLGAFVVAQGLAGVILEQGLTTMPSPEVMAEVYVRAVPLLWVGLLLFLLISVLFSMWARIIALENASVVRAFASGVRFVLRNFVVVTLMLLLTWLITTLGQSVVQHLPLGGVLVAVFSYTVRVYLSVGLMHLYLDKTAAKS